MGQPEPGQVLHCCLDPMPTVRADGVIMHGSLFTIVVLIGFLSARIRASLIALLALLFAFTVQQLVHEASIRSALEYAGYVQRLLLAACFLGAAVIACFTGHLTVGLRARE